MEIHTELLKALESVNELKGKSHDKIKVKFDEIAEILLTQTKIVKGFQEYYITDIEFYLYCKGHEDIITYPRYCLAGDWFFHPSGIDISFQSCGLEFELYNNGIFKPKLSDSAFFGGILLRGIKLIKCNNKKINDRLNGHPQNICYELFDKFNAIKTPKDFPILVTLKENRNWSKNTSSRINIIDKKNKDDINACKIKAEKILKKHYTNFDELIKNNWGETFKAFTDKPYRYTLKESK